jgi:hypothetical protein
MAANETRQASENNRGRSKEKRSRVISDTRGNARVVYLALRSLRVFVIALSRLRPK